MPYPHPLTKLRIFLILKEFFLLYFLLTFTAIEKLQNMLKLAPEKTELENIAAFTGDPSTLGNVDKYFKLLAALPNYTLRLKALIAKENFQEEMGTLRPGLNDIVKACKGKIMFF